MAEQKNNQEAANVEEALSQSEAFIVKNKKTIISAIVVVVLIIAGVVCYKNFISAPRELKASEALFPGERYFDAEQFEVALNGDSLGYMGFVKIAKEYSSTDAGNLAKAYAGISYAQLGNYQEAVSYLESFNGKDQAVAPAALGTLGNCYAQLGNLEKAASTLKKAADKADSHALSPIYLIQAGQIYEKLGKADEALKVYKEVKEKYFNSYQSYDIDKYIEKVSK
jgi:tetratricopeptide (TPR) repeat protein